MKNPEKRYEVIIELQRDKMSPKIECLAFADTESGCGLRITGMKGCGSWEVIKQFKCSFTLNDLKQFSITVAK